MQLVQKLFLCFAVDIAVKGQAIFLVADDDAPFPQTVLLFADTALTVGPALSHVRSPHLQLIRRHRRSRKLPVLQ